MPAHASAMPCAIPRHLNDTAPVGGLARTPTAGHPAGSHPGPCQTLDSRSLLQGQGSVAIAHNGVVYRLQATKLGKLILTK